MSFMEHTPQSVQDTNSAANNAVTLYGGADAATQVVQRGSQGANAANGLPGSGILGHLGGALAGLGLANDVYDMTQNGVGVDNGLSAAGNMLGLGSWAAGTFGAAGGAASTVAAPVMAAAAGGLALGSMGNSFIADTGLLGKDEHTGKSRSWSDMAGDWGADADEWAGGGALGTVAGVGATLAGSVVGTAGTIATIPGIAAKGAWDLGKAGVGLAGDAAGATWDAAGDAASYVSSW